MVKSGSKGDLGSNWESRPDVAHRSRQGNAREENGEEEGNRRTPEYIVTLRIKASTLPTVEKKANGAFGDKLVRVEHVKRNWTRQGHLDEAKQKIEEAAEIVGELKGEMEERRDNTPRTSRAPKPTAWLSNAWTSLSHWSPKWMASSPASITWNFPDGNSCSYRNANSVSITSRPARRKARWKSRATRHLSGIR